MKRFLILVILLLNIISIAHANERGLFWKLKAPNGSTHYLFGTIHTDDNRIIKFLPVVKKSISASDLLVVEIKPDNHSQNLLMKDHSLKSDLTDDELKQIKKLSEFHVMYFENVIRMKPWLLAIIFDSPKPHTEFNQDYLLMAMAEDLDKEVLGIESSQEHFATMDSLSLDEQLIMLRAVLKKTDKERLSDYNLLMKDYLSADLDQIRQTDERLTGKLLPEALWAKIKIQLMDERNKKMILRIKELSKDKQLFIAVGASHLAGQDGLLNQLKQSGFKITPMKAFE
ncbi:MAG TPA: TraB/GumN family protein [Methylophilaceae bacterium]|mgnify:CR=1 FL=1|nr:TraB/GumN family protein [Methylophilaceae bacterium]